MNGFLNLYKESGFTSHDCVAKLRRILKQKKIGHMGTLDPDAAGVLPVAIGKATRLIELFEEDRKCYRVTMLLGTVTDTLDLSGTVLEASDVTVSEQEVLKAILSFGGEQMQVPPMYSALKKDGKKLYELARLGITIEREPRPVTFYGFTGIRIELPEAMFDVTCSKGTYIRSLCDDIGRKLGCGACMKQLIRLRAGAFDAKDAFTLAQVEEMAGEGRQEEFLLPMTDLFPGLPQIRTLPEADVLAHNGNPLRKEGLSGVAPETETGRFWLFDSCGKPIGIYEWRGRISCPVKMVYEA